MNRNFKLLMGGQLVSQVGDKFHMIALAFWVLETTGSSAKMGAVLAASMIPSLLLGFVSGTIIDRYPRKWFIVGTDLIRGVVILLFAGMMLTEMMSFPLILVLQVLLSINAAFFDPAIPAVIPQVVAREQLGRANAIHQGVNSFAMIGGAALGGIAVATIGYVWVFVIDGLSFLISAGFEALIRIPAASETREKAAFSSDLKAGYAYLFSSRTLLVILFMVMIIHFFVGGIEVFMPVIAKGAAHGGPGALGLFQASLGGGILVMSLLLTRFSVSGKEKRTLFTSVMAMGGVQALTCFISPESDMALTGYAICFFFWGAAMIRAAVSFKTLLQTHVDNRYGGRVFAMASTIGNAAIPAAMIVFGLLLDSIDYTRLLPASGLALAATGLIGYGLFREEKDGTQKLNARRQEGATRPNRSET